MLSNIRRRNYVVATVLDVFHVFSVSSVFHHVVSMFSVLTIFSVLAVFSVITIFPVLKQEIYSNYRCAHNLIISVVAMCCVNLRTFLHACVLNVRVFI